MNLDRLEIDASIRSGWQALDLGLLMARHWWRTLTLAGLLAMAPLASVLLIAFAGSPLWVLAIVWWLKPFFERLPLYIASRRLFGEPAGAWSSMRTLPLKDALPWLLWRRLSPQRAFDNPVTVLEGLTGGQRGRRLAVLHGKYSDVAIGNQVGCFLIELLLAVGFLFLFTFFVPDSLAPDMYDRYQELTPAGEWLYTIAGLLAMLLVLPFHTMAGFALYLNRRIELEAWDIEIAFRRLAERKRREAEGAGAMLAACLLALALGLGCGIGDASAAQDHDRESAERMIAQVLDGEDFGQPRTVRKWRFRNWSEEMEEEEFPEWMIELAEWSVRLAEWSAGLTGVAAALKTLLIALAVGLAIYLLWRFRGPLGRLAGRRREPAAPAILFGLDVSPQSLPPDVPAEVMRLWRDDADREALSLLYRATLSRLIDRYQLGFRSSHTEAECAALVEATGRASLADFFHRLTDAWRQIAYGHQRPRDDTLRGLCERWTRELAGEGRRVE